MSLLLLVLLLERPGAFRAEFNFDLSRHVRDRVKSFLDAPADVLHQLERYRSNGGFDRDMGAADRDAFLRLNSASMGTHPEFMTAYYGLEDGTFAGHGPARTAIYREPGHSGYAMAGGRAPGNPAMGKYFGACVNSTSGGSAPCRMSEGGKYTECTALAKTAGGDGSPLFDCVLERCADEGSRRDCEALGNEMERDDCQANVKWCSSYTIKHAPGNVTLGYVPRSTYCTDRTGVPSQTRGQSARGQLGEEWGNCYYDDGVTLVERSLEGDYAYCGGNGKVCNDTFVGAWSSRDYDPRWRGWYIDTKALQKPNWSPPYPFFPSPAMGITYSVPIYSTQGDGRTVFAGVLALDYNLHNIADFLQENFKDSPTVVAIFERAEPHYMIASSTGGSVYVVVLVDDMSKPCPDYFARDGSCKPVRVKAADYSDHDISVAFSRQKEEGFPETELVATMAKDGDLLYATKSNSFSVKDAELDWWIMIMTPVETEEVDQIVPGKSLFGALIALAGFGFLVCSTLAGLIVRNRKERELIVSDWRFMTAFIGGCALLNASCLSFLGENTDGLCLARMWLVHFFFVFALSFLFAKTYRMYKLVGAGFRRCSISHAQTARMTLPLIGVQTLILIIFTFVDPYKRVEIITSEGSDITHRYVCAHDTPAFFVMMLLYEGGLIVVGCVLAFKTRRLRDEFNESKQIILAMYDTAVVGSVVMIVSKASETYQAEQRILFTLGIFWTTTFASMVFVLPRWMQMKDRHRVSGHGSGPPVSVTGLPNGRGRPVRVAGTTDLNRPQFRPVHSCAGPSDAANRMYSDGEMNNAKVPVGAGDTANVKWSDGEDVNGSAFRSRRRSSEW